jgi:hypothetical protein
LTSYVGDGGEADRGIAYLPLQLAAEQVIGVRLVCRHDLTPFDEHLGKGDIVD